MSFFERVELAPVDPILGLVQAFKEDVRPHKVNLGVGSYRTAALSPFIFTSVKQAEHQLWEEELDKEYLPIEGQRDYLNLSHQLVFNTPLTEKVAVMQALGGTGALRLAGQFLKNIGLGRIYIPEPTWGNHRRIFMHAGLQVETIPYYDRLRHSFDYASYLQALQLLPERSIVLLHASCHNPTGLDPSAEQWNKILEVIQKRHIFPLFDMAYQGFGKGLDADAAVVRLFKDAGVEMAVAVSYSKNFGLYAERTGVLFFLCKENRDKERVLSQIKVLIRGNYSNPPAHGVKIIKKILQNKELTASWKTELEGMRLRIGKMRKTLVVALQKKVPTMGIESIAQAQGMFAFTGLSSAQVDTLISKYSIYMTQDGRINLAGLNDTNLEYVVEAISKI
jgi:aspartate/tyrosine/aromatic aminotransferase